MDLDSQNGDLGAEYEQNKSVCFFLQNITDSTVYRDWIQNITIPAPLLRSRGHPSGAVGRNQRSNDVVQGKLEHGAASPKKVDPRHAVPHNPFTRNLFKDCRLARF